MKGGITILQFHVTGSGSRTQSTRPSYCVHLSTSPEMTGRTQHNRRCPRVEASSLVFPRPLKSSLVLSSPPSSSQVLPRPPTSSHVLPRPPFVFPCPLTSSVVLSRPLTTLTKTACPANIKIKYFYYNLFGPLPSDCFLVCLFVCLFPFLFCCCYVSFIVSLVKLFVRYTFFSSSTVCR